MKMKNSNNLNIKIFNQLTQLFMEKFSNLPENIAEKLFNRISNLLGSLDIKEQITILQLFEKVEYFSILDYEMLLVDVIKKMLLVVDTKNIIFTPLISQRVQREVKSSMLVTYLFKSNVIKYEFPNSSFQFSYKTDLIESEIINLNNKNKKLAIVDDFIGTGNSALEVARYFIDKGVKKEKIIFVSLVTLTEGETILQNHNYQYFYAKKSLTLKEHTHDLTEDQKNQIYNDIKIISEKIKVNNKGEFLGYHESEALISMIRTPNNSLNILWEGVNSENIPFPRIK